MTQPQKCIFPFDASPEELTASIEAFVDTTIASLSSFYLELPRGERYLEYEGFNAAYDCLFGATEGFSSLNRSVIEECINVNPGAFTVLRCIVGVSPPDLADMATEKVGIVVTQGAARTIDQKSRRGEKIFTVKVDSVTNKCVRAMIEAACQTIERFSGKSTNPLLIHRLEKIDTLNGIESLRDVAKNGVAYPVLLYERLLGRPFASHRDSVSELVGEIVEAAIVKVLTEANIPFHKTGRAEAIAGFDQAPDFLIPDKFNPKVVIEAKLTQDDGTARDKVTRVQHLNSLSQDGTKFEVVACIDGRGFRIRREDMKKLIRATKGKVFSVGTIDQLVEKTSLNQFTGLS